MKCPNCSAEASESAKFCSECGFLLKDKQAAKIFDMSSPHAYTPHHIAEEILSNKSVMEGERKQVTVLFADVSGFTSISGRLDPEDVHKIMDGTFHILTETIHKYQGTINQFTGDGIMALFGAPLAIEGNADKACQAALEIQHLVGHYALKLSDRFGIDFKMRIGLNTGLVFVGSIGDDLRMDYTALGDTTNLASRLEGMATPGSILVSAFTYKRAKNDFIFKEAVQAKVKGKEASVDIYELLDRRKTSTKITERQVTSVLVGRDKELSILEEQVRKGIGGEGCIVNIIGEAGIGKSRLKVELTKLLIAKETKILEGRATTIDRGTSYYPLISLLRRWAEIRGDDGAETASLKLESAVRNICREETYEIFPFIATLMGMELKDEYAERVAGIVGEALENIIAKHVSELIIHISEIKPLVLIIEDLHWADESTFKLLEFLYRAATGRRIVFINLLRPAYEERDKHILRVEEESSLPVTTITLHPLDGDSSALLIDKLLHVKGLPTKLKDMIVERSGGNPFFIEEVLRSILDEGGVRVAADGQFEVTDKIDNVFIPYTINDVLMSRFDRLDDQTKEIVKVASVIGRSFFHRVLTEILEDGRDIESDLSYLKSIQILDERRRIGEVEYFFKHALAQEVAYQSIIIERRKALHLSVAKAIESIFRDRLSEFYGTLVVHYTKGGNDAKTEEYLIKAGEEALKSSGSSEALTYLREGLSLYLKKHKENIDADKVALIERNIAVACYAKGELTESIKYFDKVLSYSGARFPTNPIKVAFKFSYSFLIFLVSIYFPFLRWKKEPTREENEFLTLYFYKLQALTQVNPKRYFIESFYFFSRISRFDYRKLNDWVGMVGICSISFSWTGLSFRLSGKILSFINERMDRENLNSLLYYELFSMFHNVMGGSWGDMPQCNETIINYGLNRGMTMPLTTYIGFRGAVYIYQGYSEEATKVFERLSEIAETYNNHFARYIKYDLSTRVSLYYGRPIETIKEVYEVVKFIDKMEMKVYKYYFHALRGRAQIMLGDMNGAKKSLEEAESRCDNSDRYLPHYYGCLISTNFIYEVVCLEDFVKRGEAAEISSCARRALEKGNLSVKVASKEAAYSVEVFRYMGICYWLIGKQEIALKWWRRSICSGEKLGARLELSRTYMEVGKRLLEPGSRYQSLSGLYGNDYLERAGSLFKEMNLEWDLRRLNKLLEGINIDEN